MRGVSRVAGRGVGGWAGADDDELLDGAVVGFVLLRFRRRRGRGRRRVGVSRRDDDVEPAKTEELARGDRRRRGEERGGSSPISADVEARAREPQPLSAEAIRALSAVGATPGTDLLESLSSKMFKDEKNGAEQSRGESRDEDGVVENIPGESPRARRLDRTPRSSRERG